MANLKRSIDHREKEKADISAKVLRDDKTLVFRIDNDSRFLTVAQGLELASTIENAVMDMNMRKDGIESAEDYFIRFEDCLTPQQYADKQMAETKADKHRGDGHE